MIKGVPNIANLQLGAKTKKFLGGTALLLVLGIGGNTFYKKWRRKKAEELMATDKSKGQAEAIRAALSTFGQDWWQFLSSEEKQEIFSIASQIENLDDVYKAYTALTGGRSLYNDLQKSMQADEFQKFLGLASKGKVGSWYYAPKSEKVPAKNWVITKLPANVRTSASNVHWMYLNNNIVKKAVPAGKILGITTGQFKYDEANKVLFIEFYTFTSKKEKKTYWVAKSQVELITDEEYKKRKAQSPMQTEVIEGVKDLETEHENKKRVVTKTKCPVYNEQFKQTGIAAKNTVLGFPIMTLDTGKGKYIKFKTIQGLLRWVKAEWAVIIE